MARSKVLVLNAREYQKRKRSTLWILMIIAFVIAGAFIILRQQQQVVIQQIKLYYYDAVNQELIPVEHNIDVSGTQEKAIKTILEHLAIPPSPDLVSLIPAYTNIKSVGFQRDTCILTFQDPSVSELVDSVVKESAAVYSIVNTITEYPGIHQVKIVIEGKSDQFFHRYISLEHPLSRMTGQLLRGISTMLYFYHYPTDTLVGEFREIPDSKNLDQASFDVINQLIIGSANRELNSLIPQGTQVLKTSVENGICAINFSKEMHRFSLGAIEELALVNLIALSLTELNGIERVRFMIEGKDIFSLGGHVAVDKPIHRWYGIQSTHARIYFLRKHQHHLSFIPLERSLDSLQPDSIIQSLIKGTEAQEKEAGISTDIPSGVKLIATYPNEQNELIIDLEIELNKFLNAQQEQNFIRQMVLTITENTTIQKIRFYFEGKKLESLPFGTDTSKAFSRTDSY